MDLLAGHSCACGELGGVVTQCKTPHARAVGGRGGVDGQNDMAVFCAGSCATMYALAGGMYWRGRHTGSKREECC